MSWEFKSWYKKHGESLNDKRRKRYEEDEEYRDRVLKQNRESRRRKQKELDKEKIEERQNKKVRTSKVWREVEHDIDESNQSVKLVTVGALAKVLNRSKVGIRVLEKQGVIPPTPYRSKKGERLYTPEQIIEIRALLEKQGRLNVDRKKPRSFLMANVQLSDGSEIETPLLKIGDMAKAVGKATVTLEQMERKGVIPKTPLRLPPNRRAYTPNQIVAVKEALDRWGQTIREQASKDAIYEEILESWSADNLVGAVVLSTSSKGEA